MKSLAGKLAVMLCALLALVAAMPVVAQQARDVVEVQSASGPFDAAEGDNGANIMPPTSHSRKAVASPRPHVPRLASPRSDAVPRLPDLAAPSQEGTALALRIAIGLTLLAIIPGILVCATAFLRIIIVLSMLRHAIGMQETPPNTALIGIALFLTMFTMAPVLQTVNQNALQPFLSGALTPTAAYERGIVPLRDFMVRQTREQDLALMVELSKAPQPRDMQDISNVQLIPAYMLSELRAAFQIGFMVFLPFVLIDLIVSSLLMTLGMMMVPPATIALPLKILMFILVDGWGLLLKALIGSFH